MRASLERKILIAGAALFFITDAPGCAGFESASPELPRVFLDTSPRTTPVTGRSIRVPSGGRLQGALDDAAPGDEIVLAAGATFTGNFVLHNKPGGRGWITIRSSAMDKLPPSGTRIRPDQAKFMPRIESPNDQPAISTEPGAHNYRLIGLEVTIAPRVNLSYGLIMYARGSETTLEEVPRDIILDRMYIHGLTFCHCKYGAMLNGIRVAVVDSYISEIHGIGQEASAIMIFASPGPIKIVNNFLEAAGENFFLGGAYSPLPGVTPSDVEFRNNHLFKPMSWMTSVIPPPGNVVVTQASGGNLNPRQTYFYSVAALGTAGYYHDPGSAIGGASPEAPVKLANGARSVTVSWDRVNYGNPGGQRTADSYVVLRSLDPPDSPNRSFDFALVPARDGSHFTYTDVGGPLPKWTRGWLPGGNVWTVKNLFEVKNGQRILVDGNILENNWQNAQNGVAVLFTPRIETGAGPPMFHNVVQDITLTNNVVEHAGGGLNFLGYDDHCPDGAPCRQTKRILVRNNLFDDITGLKHNGAPGVFLQMIQGKPGGSTDIVIDHNTAINDGSTMQIDRPNGSLTLTNNILLHNQYGIHGDGLGPPDEVFSKDFSSVRFTGNVFVGGDPGHAPPGNFFPRTITQVGFANLATGDFHLAPSSPFQHKAADKNDPGINLSELLTAVLNAANGEKTPPSPRIR